MYGRNFSGNNFANSAEKRKMPLEGGTRMRWYLCMPAFFPDVANGRRRRRSTADRNDTGCFPRRAANIARCRLSLSGRFLLLTSLQMFRQ